MPKANHHGTEERAEAPPDIRGGERCVTEDFLAHLLHDLKTPVITIKGYAKRLQEEKLGTLTAEQAEAVALITESCDRLEHDLKMILEYARSASRTEIEIPAEPFDLTETITGLVKSFKPLARRKKIALTADMPRAPLAIHADRRMLDRAVANLVDNAIKFTDPGGWVKISLSEREEVVEVRVSDSGKGMEKSKVNLIFKPFEQVIGIDDRELRGVGLGLANVKRYVELHRGVVAVESEVGKGSTFIIRLPKRQSGAK
ncbi:MAG: HAMP domain-containing sensor histidine kinase [Nitrospirota bacterium]